MFWVADINSSLSFVHSLELSLHNTMQCAGTPCLSGSQKTTSGESCSTCQVCIKYAPCLDKAKNAGLGIAAGAVCLVGMVYAARKYKKHKAASEGYQALTRPLVDSTLPLASSPPRYEDPVTDSHPYSQQSEHPYSQQSEKEWRM